MAQFHDISSLRRAFVRKGGAFYIVKGKKGDSIYINDEETDIEAAADMLAEDLKEIAETAELNIYSFKALPKNGDISKATGGMLTTYQKKQIYSSDEKVEYYKQQARGTDPALLELLKEMREDAKLLREEMAEERRIRAELEAADDDDDVEEQAESAGLGAILGNPAVQQILTALVTNIGANMATQQPRAMAGVEDQPELNALVQQLLSKGVTVEHLRKLAEMPTIKIKSLLMML
jgi:hypothetical protein